MLVGDDGEHGERLVELEVLGRVRRTVRVTPIRRPPWRPRRGERNGLAAMSPSAAASVSIPDRHVSEFFAEKHRNTRICRPFLGDPQM